MWLPGEDGQRERTAGAVAVTSLNLRSSLVVYLRDVLWEKQLATPVLVLYISYCY